MSRICRIAFALLILALLAPSATPAQSADLALHSTSVSAHVVDQLHTAVFAKSDRHRIKPPHFKQWAVATAEPQITVPTGTSLFTRPEKCFATRTPPRLVSPRAPPSITSLT